MGYTILRVRVITDQVVILRCFDRADMQVVFLKRLMSNSLTLLLSCLRACGQAAGLVCAAVSPQGTD